MRPCTRCLQFNKICTFTPKRNSDQLYSASYVDLLETRISVLCQTLTQLLENSQNDSEEMIQFCSNPSLLNEKGKFDLNKVIFNLLPNQRLENLSNSNTPYLLDDRASSDYEYLPNFPNNTRVEPHFRHSVSSNSSNTSWISSSSAIGEGIPSKHRRHSNNMNHILENMTFNPSQQASNSPQTSIIEEPNLASITHLSDTSTILDNGTFLGQVFSQREILPQGSNFEPCTANQDIYDPNHNEDTEPIYSRNFIHPDSRTQLDDIIDELLDSSDLKS